MKKLVTIFLLGFVSIAQAEFNVSTANEREDTVTIFMQDDTQASCHSRLESLERKLRSHKKIILQFKACKSEELLDGDYVGSIKILKH